jgi:phosphoglycerol transferase
MAGAGLGALVAFLLGTVGGGSALLAYGISSQIRGWDRISVFISFFALVGLALGLMRIGEMLRHRGSWMFGPALLAVLVLGVLDQTTPKDAPDYSAVASAWRIDSRFGQAIEREAPAGTRVLQLPYVPFPENPPVYRMGDYDLFRGYIHTKGLDWSYGAMKGRPQDWLASADSDVGSLLPAAVGAGFRGLYVDQFGYADGGAAITQAIVATLGYNNAVLSADGRLVYFDLRPYARELARRVPPTLEHAAGAALTHPPVSTFGNGFYGLESDGTSKWHWMKSQGKLKVANTTGARQAVSVKATLNPAKDASRVAIHWPDGARQVMRIGKPTDVRRTLRLPTGASEITIRAVGPRGTLTPADGRDRRLQVVNLQITDLSIPRLENDAKR